MKIEALENDNKALSSRLKREREALQIELEDKQSVLLRYTGEVKEISHQKSSLKQQIDEYEQKIKNLISELEQQSKRHMKEISQLHEDSMIQKSQAAEFKTRVHIYQTDHEQAMLCQREAKKEVMRLTFANDELTEKLQHLEKRFHGLVQRCRVSQDDLAAIDNLIMSGASACGVQTKTKYRAGAGGMDQSSFNFYGEHS